VIQCNKRLYTILEQLVDEIIVINNALFIDSSLSWRALGKYTRPGDRKTIDVHSHVFEKLNIFLIAMVLIYSNIPILPIGNFTLNMGESIPNAGTSPAFAGSSFHLISRCRGTKFKTLWEVASTQPWVSCCSYNDQQIAEWKQAYTE